MLIVQGVPPLGGVKQGWGGKTGHLLALSINIWKTERVTSKVTITD